MKKNVRLGILSLIVFFSLLTIIKSYYFSNTYGGTDLRNRVVGARLVAKGYSPYFYKWSPADGERLLDPNDIPTRLVNGNTVTPAVFFVLLPFTYLNYPAIRFIWTCLQILAAITVIWLMLKRYEGDTPLIAASLVILGLLSSDYWFMLVEKGQIHIFYVLLFALIYFVYQSKWRFAEFVSGFIGGIFLFFRPFASMIVLGFLLHRKTNWVKGWIAGVLTGLLIFIAPNPALWKDYFKAMEEYGNEYLGKGHHVNTTPIVYPALIEGSSNITLIENSHITNMPTMYGIIKRLGLEYTHMRSYLVCGLILLFLSVIFYRIKCHSTYIHLFLFAFLTYKIFELFMLNSRSPYNLVEWTFPLFLIIHQIKQRPVPLIILLTSLLFLHNFPYYFRFQVFIGEFILLTMVFYYTFSIGPVERETGFIKSE